MNPTPDHPANTLERFRPFAAVAAFALVGGGIIPAVSTAAEGSERPNIVFLESDDHHYQAIGAMTDVVKTPNIDRLAERGILFRENVCQGTSCAPSRNSLLTGSYPHNTGIYHNRDGPLPESTWTFPSALQRAGYDTALVGKNHFKPYSEYEGRRRNKPHELTLKETHVLGFDHVHSINGKVGVAVSRGSHEDPYRAYLHQKGLLQTFQEYYDEVYEDARAGPPATSTLPEKHSQDAYTASQAIDWLDEDERGKNPFFLWVDFVHPHPPADPVAPYLDQYDWQDVRAPLPRPNPDEPLRGRLEGKTDEDFQRFRAGYYAMITALDAQVGRIVDTLEAEGRLENTVVVFAGDQGSMLGDRGIWGKGQFYRGSVNSPLVVAGPPSFREGVEIERPVQLLDLAPTFLELAEVSEKEKKKSYGESLLPLLTGEGEYTRTTAFAEKADARMATTERYKYVQSEDGENQLFDLREDPQEMNDLAGERPEVEKDMNRRIEEWLAATPPILEPRR